ncbi:MAG: chloride channel protein [Acidimicrobiia bacterium]
MRAIQRFFVAVSKLRVDTTPRLMVLAAFVGVGAGLGAVALIKLIEFISHRVADLHDVLGGSRGWILVTLPIGLWIAWWLTDRFGREAAGHGVPQIMAAIVARSGRIPFRIAPLKTVATAATLGVGGSVGREGPIAQIGAAIGSGIGSRLRLGEGVTRSLIGAGTAAGISATFNAPIAGMLFALEVVLGSFSGTHMSTVVVASVLGAVVSRGLLGEGLTFQVESYPVSSPWELVLYGLLGVLAAVAAYFFLRQLDWWETRPGFLNRWLRPLPLALLIAAVGLARPEVLGTGQSFIEQLLRNESTLAWGTLLLLAGLKAVTTSATFGARASGGIFMPSLFIGATIGSGAATLIAPHWTISTIQPGAFALVGMAAVFAAVARAPLTAVLIVFEATGDYGLVLPLMLATMLAMLLADRFHPESAYTMVLTRLGITSKPTGAIDLLDEVTVGSVCSAPPVVLDPNTSLGEAQGMLDRHRLHGAPVIEDDRLVGILAVSDIRAAGGPSDQVTVARAMTVDPVTVTPELAVSEAMHRMSALGVGRLPVVSAANPTRLVASFRREDAVAAYHQAVGSVTQRSMAQAQRRVRTGPEARFFDLEIPMGSRAAGRPVREVPWPEGCLVVSLQRGPEVLVALGEAVVREGDFITCFGSSGAQALLAERLAPTDEDNPA